ncbi:hypothetical protein RchiOBHm_Chr6g0249971 [Rosa chinensis]|uniref:Uncharacterized protein n=1 Tax=Rosa chinensis TaxID=74649 RepID=A0A2P6PKE8_ROSCH|nr:hypothetical protein RchiOBHm_Chr6g0249971 [Rosa chinensis]
MMSLSFRGEEPRILERLLQTIYTLHCIIMESQLSGMILNFTKGKLFLRHVLLQLKNQDLLSLFSHKIMHRQHGAWMNL